MDLQEITTLTNGPVLVLIRWLQGQNCLASPLRCNPCNQGMVLTERNQDHVDGYLWLVYLVECNPATQSIILKSIKLRHISTKNTYVCVNRYHLYSSNTTKNLYRNAASETNARAIT